MRERKGKSRRLYWLSTLSINHRLLPEASSRNTSGLYRYLIYICSRNICEIASVTSVLDGTPIVGDPELSNVGAQGAGSGEQS